MTTKKTNVRWKTLTKFGSQVQVLVSPLGSAELVGGRFGWSYRISKENESIRGMVETEIYAKRLVSYQLGIRESKPYTKGNKQRSEVVCKEE